MLLHIHCVFFAHAEGIASCMMRTSMPLQCVYSIDIKVRDFVCMYACSIDIKVRDFVCMYACSIDIKVRAFKCMYVYSVYVSTCVCT